jgi:hypothetical protein
VHLDPATQRDACGQKFSPLYTAAIRSIDDRLVELAALQASYDGSAQVGAKLESILKTELTKLAEFLPDSAIINRASRNSLSKRNRRAQRDSDQIP